MSFLMEIALSNLVVAAFLSLLGVLAGLWGRQPALTHALWLLVLLKLITPPLFRYPIHWPASAPVPMRQPMAIQQKSEPDGKELAVTVAESEIPSVMPIVPNAGVDNILPEQAVPAANPLEQPEFVLNPQFMVQPAVPNVMPPVPVPIPNDEAVSDESIGWSWGDFVMLVWPTGSVAWLTLALLRLWRFSRLLRFAQPAPTHVRELAQELAECLQVRCPTVGLLPGNVSPMLWAFGSSPRLFLPAGLIERLTADQLRTLLAHELAHWRRRDHRVRWLEVIVLTIYWWCPLAWWARRELRQAEEECCDAWVVALLPASLKTYALALVETVDFLSGAPAVLPAAASGLGQVRHLKRRLTMILKGKTPQALTFAGLLGVAGVGLLLLPLVPGWAQAPPDDAVAQQETKKDDRKRESPEVGRRRQDFDRARAEVRRMEEEFERFRQEVEKRQREMQQEIQQRAQDLRRAVQQLQLAEERIRAQADRGEEKKPMDPKRGPMGPMPFVFPHASPMGPGFGPFGPDGVRRSQVGSIEQKLNEVERKLDMLLKDVRDLRNAMKQAPKGVDPLQWHRGTDQPDERNKPRQPGAAPVPNPRPRDNSFGPVDATRVPAIPMQPLPAAIPQRPGANLPPLSVNPPNVHVNGRIELVDSKDGTLVQISLGTDQGVSKDHTLEVYRLRPEAKYLGIIRVVESYINKSVARQVDTGNSAVRPELKQDDLVTSKIGK